MLAAEMVGSGGRVVGIDRNPDVIASARRRAARRGVDNVLFVHCDLESIDHGGRFDAALCRYVLIHQSDPTAFLTALRRPVRRGGILAVHEMDTTRGLRCSPQAPFLGKIDALLQAAIGLQADSAPDAGGRLVELFAGAGLPVPHMFAEIIVEGGQGGSILEWVADLFTQAMPHLVTAGVIAEGEIELGTLLERLRLETTARSCQIESIPQVCAWTRV